MSIIKKYKFKVKNLLFTITNYYSEKRVFSRFSLGGTSSNRVLHNTKKRQEVAVSTKHCSQCL